MGRITSLDRYGTPLDSPSLCARAMSRSVSGSRAAATPRDEEGVTPTALTPSAPERRLQFELPEAGCPVLMSLPSPNAVLCAETAVLWIRGWRVPNQSLGNERG